MNKVLFVIISLSFLFYSCNKKIDDKNNKQDLTIQEKTNEIPIIIDDSYIQAWDTLNADKAFADKDVYKLGTFTRLKEGQDQFSYYILEELNWGDLFKSYLIYEDYESESAVWLANYDQDYNLIDAIEVYYDNAEGAFSTKAKIDLKQHSIELTQYNLYANPETTQKVVRVISDGKFEK